MPGTLYVVGTPIGNLGDLSPRAAETLAKADFIAAEDTRVTLKLLNHLGIKKPLICYFEHNRAEMGEKLLARLLDGESCALVTDAGMPAISDPGEDIVRRCAENGVSVAAVPGPSALITALAVSGLPTQRFCFEGFLSTTAKNRREHLESLKGERRTMLFYEAPHKLLRTLSDLLDAFGDREVALCRELTKLHEEVFRGTLSQALSHFTQTPPRGEFVLVLRGAAVETVPAVTEAEAVAEVLRLRDGGCSLREACRAVSEKTGHARNTLYTLALWNPEIQ
ncbi:MAG: 16S rRNA (cytidine(1402)-2'-O)-methyltransferase [Oscillospiraceae bacterium]|nr:16S rRNA (cytidine(1402)-2'-O)-methyltransferase [Oscillospiraceae bacterium]